MAAFLLMFPHSHDNICQKNTIDSVQQTHFSLVNALVKMTLFSYNHQSHTAPNSLSEEYPKIGLGLIHGVNFKEFKQSLLPRDDTSSQKTQIYCFGCFNLVLVGQQQNNSISQSYGVRSNDMVITYPQILTKIPNIAPCTNHVICVLSACTNVSNIPKLNENFWLCESWMRLIFFKLVSLSYVVTAYCCIWIASTIKILHDATTHEHHKIFQYITFADSNNNKVSDYLQSSHFSHKSKHKRKRFVMMNPQYTKNAINLVGWGQHFSASSLFDNIKCHFGYLQILFQFPFHFYTSLLWPSTFFASRFRLSRASIASSNDFYTTQPWEDVLFVTSLLMDALKVILINYLKELEFIKCHMIITTSSMDPNYVKN